MKSFAVPPARSPERAAGSCRVWERRWSTQSIRIGNSCALLYTSSPEKASCFFYSFTNLFLKYEEGVNTMPDNAPSPSLRPPALLSQFQLKLLALVSMTVDHTAAVLGRETVGTYYQTMRTAGRLAFPIYCFLLVEGYCHTRNVGKYLSRLMLAALLSEIPFELAAFSHFPCKHGSVMITLSLGLMTVLVLDRGRESLRRREASFAAETAFCWAVISALMGAAFFLHSDYRGGGILLIVLFFLFRGQLWALLMTVPPVLLIFYSPLELWGTLALVPLALYSGKPGPRPGGRAGQWFFYLYYPLHLSALVLLRTLVFHIPVTLELPALP